MTRKLAGLVFINGTDDENWPFDNELVQRSFQVQAFLNVDQPAVALQIPDVRWGGECRVEVRVTARALGRGEIQIEGNAKFFEGTSEDTQDLEDEKVVTFLVPRNTANNPASTNFNIQLNNAGFGGGDHAEISFSLTNSLVEED
ncbi:MAG: hypothetical protein IM504_19585 [Microcystis sp. M038S2]|jgi:hypothetical protein|uniref:hypothetical protein n=1 Tax=unclassified Microcystis TaxID=2643300 RepID=UPI0025841CA7|nr:MULTISPECIES: hypothetical protein [unclassified Microcystis]MCA2685010.1 hypothetical protein [Microcystis sp. M046S2]MCA2706944.1 hypothetical protein [Microcystis sp. M038S2]MCA3086900.1 hypothetical protein [Rhodocyclaceae bacterium]NCR42974.1 hypothetical protein [Microcystis aeruginosa SX13-01]